MYRVESLVGDRWSIVDDGGQMVFVGNKLQAEEWLDCQENAQWETSGRRSWFRELVRRLQPCQIRGARLLNMALAGWARQFVRVFCARIWQHPQRPQGGRPSLRLRRFQ